MQIKMRGNLVAVKKLGKPGQKSELEGFIRMPEVADNQGVIRFIGPDVEGLREGQRVFYGNKRTEIRMNGEDVFIMEVDNVYATVEDVEDETQSPQK